MTMRDWAAAEAGKKEQGWVFTGLDENGANFEYIVKIGGVRQTSQNVAFPGSKCYSAAEMEQISRDPVGHYKAGLKKDVFDAAWKAICNGQVLELKRA